MHLTWGETPRSYGVFGSQVIAQFVANNKATPASKFLFASGLPIINSGMTREKFGYFNEYKKIREMLGNIPFHVLPIYAPQNLLNSSANTFKWLHGLAHWHLARLIKNFNPDVIHCRSYHAAWAALCVRRDTTLAYKIIFDCRGLYPEEVALKKCYPEESKNYLYLKYIERQLLMQCDFSVAVSDPMEKHYRNLGAKECRTIYLSADAERLKPLPLNNQSLGPVNFCYVGALSEDTWHKTSELLRLFQRLRELIPNSILTIITTSDHDDVRYFFRDFSITDVIITQTRSLEHLKSLLVQADFGILSYFMPISAREKMLADMVLAVKTAEYLCNGLPVIVNHFCGGAAAIVKSHDLGIVYDPTDLVALKAADILTRRPTSVLRNDIATKARRLFDYNEHARDYVNIYKELLAKN